MNENRLNKYAELVIRVGMNIHEGQRMIITSSVDAADFARRCVDQAYRAGCREVIMNWTDGYIARQRYLYGDEDIFDLPKSWKADMYNTLASEGAAWLWIDDDDPELLKGVEQNRIRRDRISSESGIKTFRNLQSGDFFPWCIVAVPGRKWAAKVFPELEPDEAVEKLWDAILNAVRVGEEGDPIALWNEHNARLRKRVETLNGYNFKCLKYKNSLGTDLTVELPEGHFWDGGNSRSGAGFSFNANMPTEEVFTAPKRDGVNGVACASMPLVINGDIAEGFRFTFENGRIVDIQAERGLELLKSATSIDEGASYLGEAALVPWDTPISRSGILFYNTLFDENASCHLAFGSAYPCIEGGADMNDEEKLAHGLNESMTHVDFMIGTEDMSIIGVTHEGEEIPVFADGNFAF